MARAVITYGSAQSATVVVQRSDVQVAPETFKVVINPTGFTQYSTGSSQIASDTVNLYYETTVVSQPVGVSSNFLNSGDVYSSVKTPPRGREWMWTQEVAGDYTYRTTVLNMRDYSEVAIVDWTVAGTQDPEVYFTSGGRYVEVVSLDGNETNLPSAYVGYANKTLHTTLDSALTAAQTRDAHTAIIIKQGESHTAPSGPFRISGSSTPNIYISTFQGNAGSSRPVLASNFEIIGGTNTSMQSVSISGLERVGTKDPTNPAETISGQKGFSWEAPDVPSIIGLHNCIIRNVDIGIQSTSVTNYAASLCLFDCSVTNYVANAVLNNKFQFFSINGCGLAQTNGVAGTYVGSDKGWMLRSKSPICVWKSHTRAIQAWDSTDIIQSAMRIDTSRYAYVASCTVQSGISLGTNDQDISEIIVEGNFIGMDSLKQTAVVGINVGLSMFNNIVGCPSTRQNIGNPAYIGGTNNDGVFATHRVPNSGREVVGYESAMYDVRFNSFVSLSDESTFWEGRWLRATDLTNTSQPANLYYCPYQAVPRVSTPIDTSSVNIPYEINPYSAYDFAAVPSSGISDQAVHMSGTGLGFTEGQVLTQGAVTAEIRVVQESNNETRLWLGNIQGGTFLPGAVTDAGGGSGVIDGQGQRYSGCHIKATPQTFVSWTDDGGNVPPVDIYGNSRTRATAYDGAVQSAPV